MKMIIVINRVQARVRPSVEDKFQREGGEMRVSNDIIELEFSLLLCQILSG